MTGMLREGLTFDGRRRVVAAMVMAAGIMLATAAHGASEFEYNIGDFGTDWAVNFTANAGGGGSSGPQPAGGNPGSFYRVSLELAGSGTAWHANISTTATVTPSVIGSIGELHFTWHQRNSGTGDVGIFPALRQDGSIYVASLGSFPGAMWGIGVLQANTFTCASFTRIIGSGPTKPDCSLSGPLIEFGFAVRMDLTGTTTAFVADIDNFHVDGKATDAEITVTGTTKELDIDVLDHGCVLVGTTGMKTITVENTGLMGSTLSGTFPAVTTGPHDTAGTLAFGPLAPTQTASRTYTFVPTQRTTGIIGQAGTITSDAGNVLVNFNGRGVAPLRSVDASGANVGTVRIGTSANAVVTVANTGDGNCSGAGMASNLNGSIPAAATSFAGSGGSFSIADGQNAMFTYTFTPTTHGPASEMLTITFSNGSANGQNQAGTQNVTLSGVGVGPLFASTPAAGGTIDFGTVPIGEMPTQNLTIVNDTDDETTFESVLTLHSAALSGGDAAAFALDGFTPDTELYRDDELPLTLRFNATSPGLKTALLTIATDENAEVGGDGTDFTYVLQAAVVAPPAATKSFSQSVVLVGETLALQLTLANPAENPVPLTGLALTDPLPDGLRIATPNGLTSDCDGTVNAPAGGDTVSISDVTLAPGASCTVSVTLVAQAPGRLTNVTSAVTANEAAAGPAATASVLASVVAAPAASTAALALMLLALAAIAARQLRTPTRRVDR